MIRWQRIIALACRGGRLSLQAACSTLPPSLISFRRGENGDERAQQSPEHARLAWRRGEVLRSDGRVYVNTSFVGAVRLGKRLGTGRCRSWGRSPFATLIRGGPCHCRLSCGDLLRVLRLGVVWMTATGLRLSGRHRSILDALVLSAALDAGLNRWWSLLSDTRAGEEGEHKSGRNAET